MFNFIIVYKLDPPVPKGDLYTEKRGTAISDIREVE